MQACMIGKMEVDGGNTLLTLPTDTLGLGALWLLLQQCWGSSFTGVGSRVWSAPIGRHHKDVLVLGLVDSGGLLLRAVF